MPSACASASGSACAISFADGGFVVVRDGRVVCAQAALAINDAARTAKHAAFIMVPSPSSIQARGHANPGSITPQYEKCAFGLLANGAHSVAADFSGGESGNAGAAAIPAFGNTRSFSKSINST